MTTIDKTIQELFQKLEERKKTVADLKAKTQKGWVTNCTWKIPFTGTVVNIQTCPEDQLVQLAGEIISTFGKYKFGADMLGINIGKVQQINGYTVDEWKTDLTKRLATITIRSEEAKLAELEARLNSVLSPEERRRIEVELIAKSLL